LMLDKLEKMTGQSQKEEEDPWGEDAPVVKPATGGEAKG